MTKGGVLLGAVLIAVLASGTARADHATEMKAREDFAAGRFDQALDLFAKLYAETLNPIYLRNIGRCHQKMREPQKAIDAFQDYLAKGKKISADEKTEIQGYIKEMTALRDEQARSQAPPPGPPAAPVTPIAPAQPQPPPGWTAAPPPGAEATPPPGWTAAPPPGAGPADSTTLVAQPAPAAETSSPFYAKWWFWAIVGAVAVGVGVTAYALSAGGATKPDCPVGVVRCQ